MAQRKLLPHQERAIEALIKAADGAGKRFSISMPQGTGRLIVIGHFLSAYYAIRKMSLDSKTLFVSGRIDILNQAKELFREYIDEITIADINTLSDSIVHLVSTQYISSKEDYFFKPRTVGQYGLVILFDADYLGVESNNVLPNLLSNYSYSKIISVTSPIYNNNQLFGNLVYKYTIGDAIRDNVLVPIKVLKVPSSKAVNQASQELINANIVHFADSLVDLASDKKAIIYCSNQVHATSLANRINFVKSNKKYARAVIATSQTNSEVLNDFINNEYPRILTNVEILGSGIHLPNVEIVAFLRTTRSSSWLFQKVTAAMQPYPGKTELLILDYIGLLDLLGESFGSFSVVEGDFNKNRTKESVNFSGATISIRDRSSVSPVIGVKELAQELASLIEQMPYEQGRMIGIFGRWGRGKTFAFEETWKVLEAGGQFVRIDFHAWKFQDTPALWAYVFEKFAERYYESAGNWWTKIWRRIYLNYIRLGWYRISYTIISLTIAITWTFLFDFNFKWNLLLNLIGVITLGGLINVVLLYINYERSAKDLFRKIYLKISFANQLGVQEEVNKELKHLIKAWSTYLKNKKLILFVDDIDRCSEGKIIQIIDSLRVVLEDKEIGERLVILSAIDERILKRSIKSKYINSIKYDVKKKDLGQTLNILTREYIDKLFILGIRLGDLELNERIDYFDELIRRDLQLVEAAAKFESMKGERLLSANDFQAEMSGRPDSSVTLPDSKTEVLEERAISEKERILTKVEIRMLRDSLGTFESATPRQIRIFYFRYLLSKNILISRYKLKGKNNLWIDPVYASIMMLLIIQYGWFNSAESIAKHIDLVRKNTESEIEVHLVKERFVPKDDYLELLMVLDITTAY